MNGQLTGEDVVKHSESDGLRKVYRLIEASRREAKDIYDKSNDYRARAIYLDLGEAERIIDKVELDIIESIKK